MYNFVVTRETYKALTEWLNFLSQYDDDYHRMKMADFKTRRIQQQAYSNWNPKNKDIPVAFMQVDDSPLKNPNQDDTSQKELYELEMENNYNYAYKDLADGFEDLSDKINYFTHENDGLIDFLK